MKKISLAEALKGIKGVRRRKGVIYPIHEILLIALLAIICGATSYVKIEIFAKSRAAWLRKYLKLENGIPDACAIWDVIRQIGTEKLYEVFAEWMKGVIREVFGVAAIDGKQGRLTKDSEEKPKPLHVASAFSETYQMVLGQLAREEKSNEITAIPRLLELLEISGCIVTIDAMEMQTDISETIILKGADYCFSLGEKQKTLYEDVKLYAEKELLTVSREELQRQGRYFSTFINEYGMIKKHEYYVSNDILWLDGADNWEKLSGFGLCVSAMEQGGNATISHDCALYSVESMTAKQFAMCKRGHWAVENDLHWVLDVIPREGEGRARKDSSSENLNVLRQIALDILRMDRAHKGSISDRQFKCLLNERYLELLLMDWVCS